MKSAAMLEGTAWKGLDVQDFDQGSFRQQHLLEYKFTSKWLQTACGGFGAVLLSI